MTLSSEFSGLEYDIAYILEDMEIWQITAHIIVTDTVSALTRLRAVLSSMVVTCMCSS